MEPEAALTLHNEFSMLNLADLLLARERNHVELMRKENVVGTAVGLYLIRKKDPSRPPSDEARQRPPRTLGNSEVRDYSWPCVLAFVDDWKDDAELKGKTRSRGPSTSKNGARCRSASCLRRGGTAETRSGRSSIRGGIGGGFPVIATCRDASTSRRSAASCATGTPFTR